MIATFIFPKVSCKYSRTPYLPLGIGYLSAVLKEQFCDLQVDLVDGTILEYEEYSAAISQIRSDLVLISATLRQMKESERTAKIIKEQNPDVKIVVGGAGPTSIGDQQYLRESPFDVCVKGEGEDILPQVVESILSGERLKNIPNIIYKEDGRTVETRTHYTYVDVNSLPLPDRSLFDIPRYLQMWQDAVGVTSLHLLGSRGCPFSCAFCDRSIVGSKIRKRTFGSIIEEIALLEKMYNPDDIFFFDDTFTLSRNQVFELCTLISEYLPDLKWSAQGRIGTVDEEMLRVMKNAGCTEIYFGIESGSDKILEILNKGYTREDIKETFKICHKVGMPAGAYLILGVPGETKQDISETVDLIDIIEPSLLNFSFLTPFPGTAIHERTNHLIADWNYENWDDFRYSPYKDIFEIDPREAMEIILNAHIKKIEQGLPYSVYQFPKDEEVV